MNSFLEELVDSKVDIEILKLAPDFIKNRNQDLQDLKMAYATKDYEAISKICHKLKGFSKPFGFTTLEALAKDLETASLSQDLEAIETYYHQIHSYILLKTDKLQKLNL